MRTIASLALAAAALGCSSHVPAPDPPLSERPHDSGSAATPYTNKVRWMTASEVDNFGFDVYRGDDEEGPFERITASPVLGAVTTDLPQRYEWVDSEIDPRRAYYYFVESISMTGVRERFTPVIRAKPKLATGAGE